MAYTSILPVHRLDHAIDYVRDQEKTVKKPEQADSLEGAIAYAMNLEKTETAVFEDSIGCTCVCAFADMAATKGRFHKMGGVQGYHLIQSFAEGEVTPELAHLIGQELAERLLNGQFEAVITTHLNTRHYHNHIVFNSVSMVDGHKYHSNSRSYYEDIRQNSDALCRKYGLSIIQTQGGGGMHYAQWKAEKEGRPTWRSGIRMDIRESIQLSFTWKQFLRQMEDKGYAWKLNRKHLALKAPGMERYVRLKSLGESYTETAIRERILQPAHFRQQRGKKETLPNKKQRKKAAGIQALYYFYMYRLGIWGRKSSGRMYSLRADIRKLDARMEQLEFLQEHGITTREQLEAYRKPLEEEVLLLIKERSRLYRTSPESKRIGEITETLKPLRKRIRMCSRIQVHALEIERSLQQMEQWEQEKVQQKLETEKEKKERRPHELWK